MLKQLFLTFGLFILIAGCKQKPPDGNYCAKVHFQNPSTGKPTLYTLIVTIKNNTLEQIIFPEGHFDQTKVVPVVIPEDGKVTVVTAGGHVYKVEMKGPADKCMNASNPVQCKGKSKEGNRCKRSTDNPNGYCWQHQNQATGTQ